MDGQDRKSGILLHPTSLPSPYGIGDLGENAYWFVDFLGSSGQKLWQILPLNPTGFGDSPYQSFSAFAGQTLLISPDDLVQLGYLYPADVSHPPIGDPHQVDYGAVIQWKTKIFHLAYERFLSLKPEENPLLADYHRFCDEEQDWLDDYALFMTCKDRNDGKSWLYWDAPYRHPTPAEKKQLKKESEKERGYYCFLQFLFFREWKNLKKYANDHGVQIIGDLPIFVSMDSADVWANQRLFALDESGFPETVAGVPPDYFTTTGQLWGNPLYNWKQHKKEHFSWWIRRIKHQLSLVDLLRVDHFRGFESYWAVPYGEETAMNGSWVKAPGVEFFTAVKRALGNSVPIIAEDLGIITPEVTALRESFGFPGMKVLQFAFDIPDSDYLPHFYPDPNCVCYTGTHDNDTILGWYRSLNTERRDRVNAYLEVQDEREVPLRMIRLAISSIATFSIFPMQDVLGLGSEARMNVPGVAGGNWDWRFTWADVPTDISRQLTDLCILYGRYKE